MKIQGVVSASSQSEVLMNRMTKENITHGQTVRADILNVRVGEPIAPAWFATHKAPVFFCNIGSLKVREHKKAGDGGQLPDRVVMKGLIVETSGFFNVENALITSNGAITVTVDEKARAVLSKARRARS